MGRPRKKKGKSARRARQGILGLSATSTALSKKKSKQFAKRVEKRQEKKEERQTEELLRENVSAEKPKEEPRGLHSFVIHTGRVGRYVRQLERDLRRVMSPHTSKALRVTKRNNFKDFVVNSQFLGVSHLLVLTRTPLSVNLRIVRNPLGPTLHFRVEKYSLCRDVLGIQKRPVIYEELFEHPPLVIMSGFGTGRHLQLVQTVVQNMFPAIDVDRVKLASIRRCLLMHHDPETDLIDFRHYSIKAVPAGVSKSAKKLLQNKIPDLSKYEDISDFMLKPGQLSDSEFEGEQVELELPQDIGGRGKKRGQKTKLRLLEIGPRMTLRLVKVEEGVNQGEVLYHSLVEKTPKEIAQLRSLAPQMRKRRLRHEKEVEHATIRKLKYRSEREAKESDAFEREKRELIGRQREVTGDWGDSDEEEDAGAGREGPAKEESDDADDEADLVEGRERVRKEGRGPTAKGGEAPMRRQKTDGGKGAEKPGKKRQKGAQKTGSRYR